MPPYVLSAVATDADAVVAASVAAVFIVPVYIYSAR